MKTNVSKVNRSAFYRLINTIVPINHVLRARFDIWGAILLVGLMIIAISAIRMLELASQ
ncbi:MAG TPA: hypothetical protein VMD27_02545 [Candidatus Aquilonibacter sp.]|nr:hypothetical protein [Candidatus Aquilonibacter sp.]